MSTTPYDSLTEMIEKLDISDSDRHNLEYKVKRIGSHLKEVESLKDSIIYSGVTEYKKKFIQKKIINTVKILLREYNIWQSLQI